MTTQLSVANGALRVLGSQQRIDSLSDTTKTAARVLNDAWSDVVKEAFESYNWNFASVRVSLSRSADTPAYGYDYYYVKPADWMRTINITQSEDEEDKLRDYIEEGGGTSSPKGLIATNAAAVFLRYVSSDYMTRYGNWPQRFADYVSARLAEETCEQITGNRSKMDQVTEAVRKRKHDAINFDTVQQAPKRQLAGRLVRARLGYPYRSDDGQI